MLHGPFWSLLLSEFAGFWVVAWWLPAVVFGAGCSDFYGVLVAGFAFERRSFVWWWKRRRKGEKKGRQPWGFLGVSPAREVE